MATSEQTYLVHSFPVTDSVVVRRNGGLEGTYPNQRLEERGLVVLPVVVRAGGQESVGLLRDISQTGMFFYCNLRPAVGNEVEVLIRPSAVDPNVMVRCRCTVVRTECSVPGAATGLGVAIQEYLGDMRAADSAIPDSTVMSA